MLDAILLVFAICMDAFIVSVAYGTQNIRIPRKSIIIIAFFGTFFLGISCYLAQLIQMFVSPKVCTMISFIILLMIGIISLFQNQMKRYLQHHTEEKWKFRFKEISFVIDVYIDETKADLDKSNDLNAKEAIYLGIALSIDSLASGIAFGMSIVNPQELLLISFVMGICMISVGHMIGRRLSNKLKVDISWLSGVILIVLAFMRFI